MAREDDRKRQIMEHLARSMGKFNTRSASTSSSDRKQQILDHVRRSKG
jgi:hypothetical protein